MDKYIDIAKSVIFLLIALALLVSVASYALDKEWDRQRIQCEHREAQGYDVDCAVYYDY